MTAPIPFDGPVIKVNYSDLAHQCAQLLPHGRTVTLGETGNLDKSDWIRCFRYQAGFPHG